MSTLVASRERVPSSSAWNKADVLRIVRERVAAELDRATRRAADAAEGATHEENKPEGEECECG